MLVTIFGFKADSITVSYLTIPNDVAFKLFTFGISSKCKDAHGIKKQKNS